MRSLYWLLVYGLSFTSIDFNIIRKKLSARFKTTTLELLYEDNKTKTKRKLRKYKNRKYKRKSRYRHKSYKYLHSKPKDKRFSNQRSLRRMYRND